MHESASYTILTERHVVSPQPAQSSPGSWMEHMEHGDVTSSEGVSMTDQWPFSAEDDFTDVILSVEEQPLYTNRSLLAYASPVFACMFTDEFKEKNDKTIPLPGKSYVAISEMLAFLHPGVQFALKCDSTFRLLPLAEEYQIIVLKKACEDFLIQDLENMLFPFDSHLVPSLVAAEQSDMARLRELCVDKISEPDSPLGEVQLNQQIGLETKAKIYLMRITKLEKEKEYVEAWKQKVNTAKQRLRDIVLPHEDHCRCHVELKLRTYAQRSCSYCARTWCSDNTSTEAYRNSYQFFCSHKIGYHISHDATLRLFMDTVDFSYKSDRNENPVLKNPMPL